MAWFDIVLGSILLIILVAALWLVVTRWALHAWSLVEIVRLGLAEGRANAAYTFIRGSGKHRAVFSGILTLVYTAFTGYFIYVALMLTALNPLSPEWMAKLFGVYTPPGTEFDFQFGLGNPIHMDSPNGSPAFSDGDLVGTLPTSPTSNKTAAQQARESIQVPMFVLLIVAMVPMFVSACAAVSAIVYEQYQLRQHTRKRINEHEESTRSSSNGDDQEPSAAFSQGIALGQINSNGGTSGLPRLTSSPRDHVDDPNIVILVPTFQEPLPNLLSTIDAIAESDYPGKKLRVIIGFDGYDVLSTMYTIERLLTGAVVHGYNLDGNDEFDDVPPPPFASNPGSPALSPSSSPLVGATSPRMVPGSPAQASASASASPQKVLSPSPSMLSLNAAAGGSIPSATGQNKYNGLLKVAQYTRDSFDQGIVPGSTSNTKYSLRGQPLDPAYMGAEGGPDCITLEYKGIEYNICRFEHGGKLQAQSKMLEVVQRNVGRGLYPDSSILLFLDSDTTLVAPTVRRFVDHFALHPRLHAATGFIVSRNGHGNNFFQQLQDAEYIFMQFGTRLPEVVFGAVTCLPGALTAIKYQTMCELAEVYFNQPAVDSTFEFCRRKLGEDRFLTHLAMELLPSHSIGFIPDAIAKTEAPGNFYDLLRQRRRWLLGSLANELYCVTTPSFWVKFPGVALMRILCLFQVGGSLFYMFLFDFLVRAFQKPDSLSKMDWFMLFLVPLLNWSLVLMWSVWQRRWKGIGYFFMYCALSLFFETSYCTYTLWTVNEKTWGGPRAKAANADDDDSQDDDGEDPASIIERGGKLPKAPTAA